MFNEVRWTAGRQRERLSNMCKEVATILCKEVTVFKEKCKELQSGGCVQQEVQPGGDPVSTKVKGERDCKGWSDISSPSLVFAVLDSTVPLAVLAKIHLSLGL